MQAWQDHHSTTTATRKRKFVRVFFHVEINLLIFMMNWDEIKRNIFSLIVQPDKGNFNALAIPA